MPTTNHHSLHLESWGRIVVPMIAGLQFFHFQQLPSSTQWQVSAVLSPQHLQLKTATYNSSSNSTTMSKQAGSGYRRPQDAVGWQEEPQQKATSHPPPPLSSLFLTSSCCTIAVVLVLLLQLVSTPLPAGPPLYVLFPLSSLASSACTVEISRRVSAEPVGDLSDPGDHVGG